MNLIERKMAIFNESQKIVCLNLSIGSFMKSKLSIYNIHKTITRIVNGN